MTKALKRNIKLEYLQLGLRNFNVLHGVWLIYLGIKGFSAIDIGIFESVFHISSISFEIPSGMLADLIGRKFSRVISIILYILYIIILFSSTNYAFMVLAFIFCGASYAFESGSGEALLYDTLIELKEEETYMKINGNREIIFQLSSSIALFIGGYIAIVSYNINFLIVLIAFVTALMPILLMKEKRRKSTKKSESFKLKMYNHFIKSTNIALKDKNLLFLLITGALLAAPVTTLFFYFQIYFTDQLLISENYIGILLALHSIAGAIGGYFAFRLEKKYGEKLLLYIVPIFLVISFWMIQVNSFVYFPFIILGFLDSVFYITLLDYINRIVPSEERATVLSFNSLVFSIIMIIIFPVVGYLAETFSFQFSFMILAILVSIFYICLLLVLKKTNPIIKKEA